MAAIHGKRGVATFTGLTFEMLSFSIDASADTAECTVMNAAAVAAATHWKDFLAGFKNWTATVECLEPAAGGGIAALGTEDTLTLNSTDGLAFSGTAICTGYSPSIDANDVGKLTLAFQGVAQLSAS
jgi:hypothetical protein